VHKSGGKQASARVRYITRETEREPATQAERQLRYVAREGREDLVYTRSRNLPGWAHGSPQTYFRAAYQYEWALGNAFEEWKITLPQELSPRQNMDLMRDLVTTIAGERLPITYAFHSPQTMDGTQAQPHLHLLISGRQEDGIVAPQHSTSRNTTIARIPSARRGNPKTALYHYPRGEGGGVSPSVT
jgi:hypothetical protein